MISLTKQEHHAQLVTLEHFQGKAGPFSRNENPAGTPGQLEREGDHFSDDAIVAKLRD